MKKLALLVILIAAAVAGYVLFLAPEANAPQAEQSDPAQEASSDNNSVTEVVVEPLEFSIDDFDSIWLVVNKQRPIPLTYAPTDLRSVDVVVREDKSAAELSMRKEAATALEQLFTAASEQKLELLLGSAYRDAELQAFYYNNYVAAYGQAEADKFSAKPGTSEHQTGLVADVSPKSRNCYLEICFSDTTEGIWVSKNAHKYGFVVRYPKGKEKITGYQFEPWHLRYVGKDLATELYENDQTLEEYFSLVASPGSQ